MTSMICVSSGCAWVCGSPNPIPQNRTRPRGPECPSRTDADASACRADLQPSHHKTGWNLNQSWHTSGRANVQRLASARAPAVSTVPPGIQPFDVAGLGLNSIDLVAVVAEYPARNTKQRLQRFARLPGGQIATALSVCARLGWKAQLYRQLRRRRPGRLSRDEPDRRRRGHQRLVERCRARPTSSPSCSWTRASGERTVLWDRHPGLTIDPATVAREPSRGPRADRRLSRNRRRDRGGTLRARGRACRRSSTSSACVPASTNCCSRSTPSSRREAVPERADRATSRPGRALEAMARRVRRAARVRDAGSEGSLASAEAARSGRRRSRWTASTGPARATRFAAASPPAACGRPTARSRTCLRYANAVAALNCRALGARGGLPTAERSRAACCTLDS